MWMNKRLFIFGSILLLSGTTSAFLPSGDSDFYYELGGAAPISGNVFEGQANLAASVSWNAGGLTCGGKGGFQFDYSQSIVTAFGFDANVPSISTGRIKGAFNAAVNSIKSLTWQSGANMAVNIGGSLVLQKLNSGLYDTIMSGIAKVDEMIAMAENSCELVKEQITKDGGVIDKMKRYAEQKGWLEAAQGNGSTDSSSADAKDREKSDIVFQAAKIEKEGGDGGIYSFGGQTKGDTASNPLKINQDAVLAGYNIIQNRSVTDMTSPSLGPVSTRPILLKHFPTPQSARDFVNDVIGDKELTTCTNCTPIKATPGKGLTYVYDKEVENYRQGFEDILNGSVDPTVENLAAISAPPQVYITPKLIEMMKKDPDGPYVAGKIASEIGMITTLQKALTLRRMLYTAKKEPNSESYGFLKEGVEEAIKDLDEEISLMKTEMEINNMMASSTASKYMEHFKRKYGNVQTPNAPSMPTFDNGAVQ